MLTCLSHPADRLIPSTYPMEYARHGSAAIMEWINFCACMAAYDAQHEDTFPLRNPTPTDPEGAE